MARLLQTSQSPSPLSPNGVLAESLAMLDDLAHAGLSIVPTFPTDTMLLKAANETGISPSQAARIYAIMTHEDT